MNKPLRKLNTQANPVKEMMTMNNFWELTPQHRLTVFGCVLIIIYCVFVMVKTVQEYKRDFKKMNKQDDTQDYSIDFMLYDENGRSYNPDGILKQTVDELKKEVEKRKKKQADVTAQNYTIPNQV